MATKLLPLHQLAELFSETFSPRKDIRQNAENKIISLRKRAFYLVSQLSLATSADCGLEVQQAAAIELKNGIKRVWMEPRDDKKPGRFADMYNLSTEEKEMMKNNFMEALCKVAENRKMLKLLGETLITIARVDFPDKWPALLQQVREKLNAGDLRQSIASLVTIEKLIKSSPTKTSQEISQTVFPLLTDLVLNITKTFKDSEEYWTIICLLCKVYNASVWYKMPPSLQTYQMLEVWMHFLNMVLQFQVPQLSYKNCFGEKRKLLPWVSKKYAMKSVYRVFERYSFPQYSEEGERAVSIHFYQGDEKSFFRKCLESSLQVVQSYSRRDYVSPVVLRNAIFFLSKSSELSKGFLVIKDLLPSLLKTVLLPLMAIQPEELESYLTDELQFIRDKFNISYLLNIGNNANEAAASFISEVSYHRFQYFLPLLSQEIDAYFSAEKFSSEEEQTCLKEFALLIEILRSDDGFSFSKKEFVLAIRKTAALVALDNLSKVFHTDNSLISKVEVAALVVNKVATSLQDKFNFVRFYALKCLNKYLKLPFTNTSTVEEMTKLMLRALEDKSVPVVAQACVTIRGLENSGNQIMVKLLADNLSFVVQRLLDVSRQLVIEDVYDTLQSLIARFSSRIGSMGKEILSSLTQNFIRLYTSELQQNDDSDDMYQNEIVSIDCLASINELLIAIGDQENGKEQLRECFPEVWPAILVVFVGARGAEMILNGGKSEEELSSILELKMNGSGMDCCDYLQTVLETTRIITFYGKYVPPELWRIVPYIYIEYSSWAVDYTQDFAATIENMIQYNTSGLFAHSFAENLRLGKSNFELVLMVANFGLDPSKEELNEMEKVFLHSMLAVLLQSLRINAIQMEDTFSQTLQSLVNLSISSLNQSGTEIFTKSCMLLLYAAFFYDPHLTLKVLGNDKFFTLLEAWLNAVEFHIALSEQLSCFFGLSSLLKLSQEELPGLEGVMPNILSKLLLMAVNIRQLKADEAKRRADRLEEKRQLEQNNFSSGESSEEFGITGLKHSTYPFNVPENLNVLSPDYTNKLPETLQELEHLRPYFGTSVDMNKALDVTDSSGFVGDEQGISTEAFDKYFAEEGLYEDEEVGEEESPLDDLNEAKFVFDIVSKSSPQTQESLKRGLSQLSSEHQNAFQSFLSQGQG